MTDSIISQLAEMRLYFTACTINAAPGSAAHKRFTGYFAALDKAIAELKGNEPVKPSRTLSPEGNWWEDCGACDTVLLKWYTYCPKCGRKVKWDD